MGTNGAWWRYAICGRARRDVARRGKSRAWAPTVHGGVTRFKTGLGLARPGKARQEHGEGTNGAMVVVPRFAARRG